MRAAARETASSVYRDAILAAAEQAFMAHGYAATKMTDVARRAGMSVGALYRHFDSKEAIFVSLMDRANQDVGARMARVRAAHPDPSQRIGRLLDTMFAFIEEQHGMFLVFHQLADADRAQCHALIDHAESTRDVVLAAFRAVIADGIADGTLRTDVPADDQLAFVAGVIHGFLERWVRSADGSRLVDKAPLIAHLVLRALGGPP